MKKVMPDMVVIIDRNGRRIKEIHEIIHEMEKEHSDNYTLKFQITL